jgi:hypothetical protein
MVDYSLKRLKMEELKEPEIPVTKFPREFLQKIADNQVKVMSFEKDSRVIIEENK